jgi:hypothetical protein
MNKEDEMDSNKNNNKKNKLGDGLGKTLQYEIKENVLRKSSN